MLGASGGVGLAAVQLAKVSESLLVANECYFLSLSTPKTSGGLLKRPPTPYEKCNHCFYFNGVIPMDPLLRYG